MASQEASTRLGQKRRTRADLLRAARGLMADGRQPSVVEVADAAGISRATAYRYFSKPDAIVREALLDAVALDAVAVPAEVTRPADRVDQTIRQVFELVCRNEDLFRVFLAGAVGAGVREARGGRRLGWNEAAVEPIRPTLSAEGHRRLVCALSLLTGIETLVVLRDVCGLDPAAAEDVTRWAAQALLKAAIEESAAAAPSGIGLSAATPDAGRPSDA